MKAILIQTDGSLIWSQTPTPVPGPGEVRIRVFATAVNRADLLQRRGLYPAPAGESEILGMEAAGVIDAIGPGVEGWSLDEQVAALLAGGGYAEQVVVPAGQLLPIPEGMSFEDAAALPEVLTTAWLNLYLEGGARPGDRVLLHAGASGVGTAAIQLCRVFGQPCYVTVSSEEKLRVCRGLGAQGGALRGREDFAGLTPQWTDGHRFDLILDPVGAGYLDDNLRSLATDGRLILIGLLSGSRAQLDLGRLLVKRLRVIGSTLRSRSREDKARIIASLREQVWPHVERGAIVPVIDRVLPVQRAAEAHAILSENGTVGKIVLSVGEDELDALHEA
ncbi:MAG: NAD(P)H-quinone oxidoreductase [Deltaproteobacteria bacterium]|nr:NAD(P)H-quinone oxidoreductase [Deltaproteobacteria bacterium]